MAQAQKARKLEIELPTMNAESMDKAVQDIYIRKYIRYKEVLNMNMCPRFRQLWHLPF